MKKENIYIGSLMECKNVKRYLEDGEKTYFPFYETKTLEMGISYRNVESKNNQAILIKTKKGYIYLNSIKKLSHAVLVNMGFSLKPINAIPSKDGDLFVLEDTLVPYYSEDLNKHVFVKQLKRELIIDPRIKMGIEH